MASIYDAPKLFWRAQRHGCAGCDKLIAEVARLNFELGKAQGEIEGLRAGWSVSNHEAWEQGRVAEWSRRERMLPRQENPFPKPEKKAGR